MALAVTLLLLWIEFVLTMRGRLCLHAFRRSLFREEGGKQALSSVGADGLAHVLCTTELQTGDQCYLSPHFVYGYQLGCGVPNGLDVAAAVQASAALPGAFPPQRRPTAPLGFSFPSLTSPPPDERPAPFPSSLVLVDGGVYDNMADQWACGYDRRAQVWEAIAEVAPRPERLIVVNASGGMRYRPLSKTWLPGGSELQALNGDKDVMYDQTTAQRRLGLVARFDQATLDARDGKQGLQGALVHIAQNPYGVPRHFATEGTFQERALRAAEARNRLDQLGVSEETWRSIARGNADVATTLAPLGVEVATRLIWHAYILAAVNLHVILGFDLPDALPTQQTVRRWIAEVSGSDPLPSPLASTPRG
jgi:predicted acylesterase/phospholipase RssA